MKKKNWIPWVLLALTPLVLGGALLIGPASVDLLDPRTDLGRALLLLRLNRVLAGFAVGAALAGAIYGRFLIQPDDPLAMKKK